jgi:hypothetical protein
MTWQPKKPTRVQMAERRNEGVKLLQAGKMTQAEIARHKDGHFYYCSL